MYYIYATRRDDLEYKYWNRRKNEWEDSLSPACMYPTVKGVNRIFMQFANNGLVLGRRFHEMGWKREN